MSTWNPRARPRLAGCEGKVAIRGLSDHRRAMGRRGTILRRHFEFMARDMAILPASPRDLDERVDHARRASSQAVSGLQAMIALSFAQRGGEHAEKGPRRRASSIMSSPRACCPSSCHREETFSFCVPGDKRRAGPYDGDDDGRPGRDTPARGTIGARGAVR